MDRFAILPALEKIPYFDMKAAELGIISDFVEKDFWVCWILKQLFLLEGPGAHITFKGGTSLSKCYNAVYRFSEDIDIAIERKYLDHGESIEPAFDQSNKENDRRIKDLLLASKTVIYNEILPRLRQKVGEVLGNNGQWAIDLDPSDLHQ
jgi:predicted nucleotidyltransferase component of viral defense system